MSESRKIQASIQSPQIIRQPIDTLAFMRRYDNIAESRQRLLNHQRVKVPPSELVKLKLKKKAKKLKRTTNLKGEVSKNIIEQKKFERGQKREKPEQDIRIVGEPAPPVNIYQQPAPGGLQFDPAIERQRLALEDRRRQDDYNLAQRKLVIEATNYDVNKALADREFDLQNRRLTIEDRNKQVEIQALFDRLGEEQRQFDILQEQRRKDRKQEKKLLYEQLDAEEERFERERQLQDEARRQYEESRVIRLPAGREEELQGQTRFLPGGGPPPIPEGGFADPTPEQPPPPPPTLSRREQPSELVRQAARVQANIDSRLNEFQKEEDQRRAQREAQFLTRGLSQVDDLIQRRFSELEERQQQARRDALEPELTEEEQEQVRFKIYDSIMAGLQPQGVLAQQIEGEVESAAEDLREAQRLENQQLRAEILDKQQGLITAPQLEDKLRREQAERTRLEERLATIETDVASIQTPQSTPAATPGTSPGDIETEFEEIRRSQLESSESEPGSLGTSGSELIFQLEEGEPSGQRPEGTAEGIIPSEQVEPAEPADPGIATRAVEAAQTAGETLAEGGRLIAEYFKAPEQGPEQETRGIGRPLSVMERAVQVVEERKKQARRPQPGEQTGGALVDAEGNPIYGLGQDFPEEFQDEIEIAEEQLAAKQRSEEEQRQITAAAEAAEEQRKQQLRKAEQEAEAKARRIAEAEETAKRRNEELAQIREARLAQERRDLEERAGGVLPEPTPEAPAPQVRKAKPLVKPPTQPTGEVVRQVKPKAPVKPLRKVKVETSADVELTPERYQQLFSENTEILKANIAANSDAYDKEFADKFDEENKRLKEQYLSIYIKEQEEKIAKYNREKKITQSSKDPLTADDKERIKRAVYNQPQGKLFKRSFRDSEITSLANKYIDQNRDKNLFRRSNEYKVELNEQRALLRDATERLVEDNFDFQSKQIALDYLEYLKQNKPQGVLEAPAAARGRVEEVVEEPTRRAQVATEGEALVEEAQGAGTEPQSAVRTNFTTYQSLLPEIQQLNQVGRPKAQRQDKIYIKNTSDKKLKGLEPGAETLITGFESQNQGTLGFFTEGTRKRTQKNVIEKLIKEGKIKIYKK